MLELEIIAYDVYGNAKDGYEINDVFHTGKFIELPENYTKKDVQNAILKDTTLDITIEDDGFYNIYIEREDNGKPICELRYCH